MLRSRRLISPLHWGISHIRNSSIASIQNIEHQTSDLSLRSDSKTGIPNQLQSIALTSNEKEILRTFQYVADEAGLGNVRISGIWVAYKLLGLQPPSIDIKIENSATPHEFAILLNHFQVRNKKELFRYSPSENPIRTRFMENTIALYNYRIRQPVSPAMKWLKPIVLPNSFDYLVEDVSGRIDLTIDSLYYNVKTGEIEDVTGYGLNDLKHKIVRTITPAADIFTKEPIKLVRCIRLAVTHGFSFDSDIIHALTLPKVREAMKSHMSKSRSAHEISVIFAHHNSLRTRTLFHLLNLNSILFPFHIENGVFTIRYHRLLERASPNEALHRLGSLKFDPQFVQVAHFDADDFHQTMLGHFALMDWLCKSLSNIASSDNTQKSLESNLTLSNSLNLIQLLQSCMDESLEVNSMLRYALAYYPISHIYCHPLRDSCVTCHSLASVATQNNLMLGSKIRTSVRTAQSESDRAEGLLRILANSQTNVEAFNTALQQGKTALRNILFQNTKGEDISSVFTDSKCGLEDVPTYGVLSRFELALLPCRNPEFYRQSILLALVRLLYEETVATVTTTDDNLGSTTIDAISATKVIVAKYFQKYCDISELQQFATLPIPAEYTSNVNNLLQYCSADSGYQFLDPDQNPMAVRFILAANYVLTTIDSYNLATIPTPFFSGTEILQVFNLNNRARRCGEITKAQWEWQLCFPNGTKEDLLKYLKTRFAELI